LKGRFREARTIHKYCRALACSFARNEALLPHGILSCTTPQGAIPAASGIHLGAIHLIRRPYAWLRPFSQESVANKGPAHKKVAGRLDERKVARRVRANGPNQSSRRFMKNPG